MIRALRKEPVWSMEKTDGRAAAAMRLFEAFSGVDEDYLAACEADGGVLSEDTDFCLPRRIQKYGRSAAAVLLAVLLGTTATAATAAVFSKWDERLKGFFDIPSEAMQDKTTANGVAGKQSSTAADNGITVSAVQTLHDEKRICILLEITAPRGTISYDPGFRRIQLLTEDGEDINRGVGMEGVYVEETVAEESGEQKWFYYMDIKREIPLTMESLTLRLESCARITPQGKVVRDGVWELQLELTDVSDMTRHYLCDREVTLEDGSSLRIKEVILSPMSAVIIYDQDSLDHLAESKRTTDWERWNEIHFLAAVLDREGNVLSEAESHGIGSDGVAESELRQVLDVEEAYAVRIGKSVVFPLWEDGVLSGERRVKE